jgi:hypothetical protein
MLKIHQRILVLNIVCFGVFLVLAGSILLR